MTMDGKKLGMLVDSGLAVAKRTYDLLTASDAVVVREGAGFGDLKSDTEVLADRRIAEAMAVHYTSLPDVSELHLEGETHARKLHPQGKYLVFVDPLDGSLNFVKRCGTIGLPQSAVVTVMEDTHLTYGDFQELAEIYSFKQVLAAGVIDLRTGDQWTALRGEVLMLNGKQISRVGWSKLNLKDQIVIGEHYYSENREALAKAFAGEKGWLRNPGSAAYEMALVASGTAVAFISNAQKHHELGAGYRLVTESGGVAMDFDGRDLGDRHFNFNEQTPVILACTRTLGEEIVARLKRA